MASPAKEVAGEIPHVIRVYKDGSVERLLSWPYVPPSPNPDPQTGAVSSKDITISESPKISARLFLPEIQQQDQKLPILVYFHGGAFCVGSAFSSVDHHYMSRLVSEARVISVSVEYRMAPEHPLPAAYEDCWTAINWVASHSEAQNELKKDPRLLSYGDFERVYIGGDSAGGNIAHNIAIRAGSENLECNVKILGALLSHLYFWGSNPIGSKTDPTKTKPYFVFDSKSIESESVVDQNKTLPALVWSLVYPSAPGGIDNPNINPEGPGAPSLAKLGCSRLLVCVAEKDELRDRGVRYCDLVKESGWDGELELYEVEGEGHCFQIFDTDTTNAKNMIKRLASFLK